ncbi:MAG: BrnA antitoxin family protein [Alcanivorax sp.]|nr:BrnA antitoxin family protein [Alcanivorax sp.]
MPEFKTEAEEREFRETHDSSDYLDWSQAKPVSLPKLKPSIIPPKSESTQK